MDELSKIGRVMGQAHTGAPHEVLLVIDGTVGQNALMQAKIFQRGCADYRRSNYKIGWYS